jgi:ATP-dependent 26S proteasome regulatory subunit
MYDFATELSKIHNTCQARSVVLTGNVDDLFKLTDKDDYVTLLDFLKDHYSIEQEGATRGVTPVVYALNSDVAVLGSGSSEISRLWKKFKQTDLDAELEKTNGNPTLALEVMRQMAFCNRRYKHEHDLMFFVEGADLILPDEEISRMSDVDRRRVSIVKDWFSDPHFLNGDDSAVLIAESRSQLHRKVSRLPQLLEVEVLSPDYAQRGQFLLNSLTLEERKSDLARLTTCTAGLSTHAMRQLVNSRDWSNDHVTRKVQDYIESQMGDGVVEFKTPSHRFEDVVGFSNVKDFMKEEMIPRFRATGDEALPGAAIGGPIGGGKTYICEALAAELDLPVLVLKNLRSKWFGETDMIFERLRRALTSLDKVVVFVDEADTAFGSIEGGHETERRLTGKIQAMMSDPRLRGKVLWLLMTARIHLLSPDIRRPGRVGDLIIPILDPEGEDSAEFLKWVFERFEGWSESAYNAVRNDDFENKTTNAEMQAIWDLCKGKSAAWFAALRSQLKASKCKDLQNAVWVAKDMIPPDIEETRKYQTLQALLNCTRQSLLREDDRKASPEELQQKRRSWRKQLRELEQSQ